MEVTANVEEPSQRLAELTVGDFGFVLDSQSVGQGDVVRDLLTSQSWGLGRGGSREPFN